MATIPPDFPTGRPEGAVPGAQPKILVRKVGDQFISGYTPEELAERYDICEDLVRQLVPYCARKQSENPTWSKDDLVSRVRKGVQAKDWGLSGPEIEWIVTQAVQPLQWPQSPL